MEFENELYAERQRLKARGEVHEAVEAHGLTDHLDLRSREKLRAAWDDAQELHPYSYGFSDPVYERTRRSIGVGLQANDMFMLSEYDPGTNALLLSLLEAQHELLAQQTPIRQPDRIYTGEGEEPPYEQSKPTAASRMFRAEVNRILESHNVGFRLTEQSRIVPVKSLAMHAEVVEPTLRLLQGEEKFAAVEAAYLKALKEIRRGDAGDAVTDAATALQETLTALGCKGKTLGDLNKSARSQGLLRGSDTPLGDAVDKMVSWVAAQRNDGEAHHGDAEVELADAWAVVHMIGALILRLTNSH